MIPSGPAGKVRVALLVLYGLLAALLLAGVVYARTCPCDRIPGLWVAGETVNEPVTDWSFANDAGLCQVQVSGVLPHAVTLNCMADEQRLFLSCSNCAGKTWSSYALANPNGFIKIGEFRYPVLVTRVLEETQLDKAWAARLRKVVRDKGRPRPSHWWSFELQSAKKY